MFSAAPADLQLGDVIRCFDGPFGTGVVTQIKNNTVYVFRPYGTTSDFSCTGGVIPYVGMETVQYSTTPAANVTFLVYHRKEVR